MKSILIKMPVLGLLMAFPVLAGDAGLHQGAAQPTRAVAKGVGSVKYDKIVNECNFARTYAVDMDEPVLVAKGQYAHSYEENQKLKAIKIKILRQPSHGEVTLGHGTLADLGAYPPGFAMKTTDNYLGPDLAEYAVELSNGKRVLVRTHIYWVNMETDSFSQCPPTENDYRDMRHIQKEHPEYFKKN